VKITSENKPILFFYYFYFRHHYADPFDNRKLYTGSRKTSLHTHTHTHTHISMDVHCRLHSCRNTSLVRLTHAPFGEVDDETFRLCLRRVKSSENSKLTQRHLTAIRRQSLIRASAYCISIDTTSPSMTSRRGCPLITHSPFIDFPPGEKIDVSVFAADCSHSNQSFSRVTDYTMTVNSSVGVSVHREEHSTTITIHDSARSSYNCIVL
jgi:hypothetical protein